MQEEEQKSKPTREKKEPSELESLINEKVTLSKKLGIMGNLDPVDGYKETDEYKRIQEIDKRLWELVK
ncbi:hypothetical protein P4H94_04390 [Paenibacillus macerans]|uniref:hypothetical protein n=1 Tax=Paenibacillus macerans TaxID=44252 RepID=UPI002DBBB924|nr:hypothetical protein [Paenibacillus macerans]MEC0136126.1 hypothetical protein [Paenibacillus macerans]